MFKRSEGFTLVELMVVVLIIGILVAIAVPVYNSAKGTAEMNTCQANQRTIAGVVQMYRAATGDMTDKDAGVLSGSEAGTWGEVLLGPTNYIKSTPICPTGVAPDNTYFLLADGRVAGDIGAGGAGWHVNGDADGSPSHALNPDGPF